MHWMRGYLGTFPSYLRVRGVHACVHVLSRDHASANGFLRHDRAYARESGTEQQDFRHPETR
jgi:hypothetical protein